jgi:repressor LexA
VSLKSLSKGQERVYTRLKQWWQQRGAQPSLRELAGSLGISYPSLRQHLEALEGKGYLKLQSQGRGRPPILTLGQVGLGVPLLGNIPAGPLSEALAHPEGYLALPFGEDHFALRVTGDSMADLIQPGDVVVLRRTQVPVFGAICAVRVAGSEATLKYLARGGDPSTFVLRAHNPAYPEVDVAAEEVVIDGVYRGLLRGEVASLLIQEGLV